MALLNRRDLRRDVIKQVVLARTNPKVELCHVVFFIAFSFCSHTAVVGAVYSKRISTKHTAKNRETAKDGDDCPAGGRFEGRRDERSAMALNGHSSHQKCAMCVTV